MKLRYRKQALSAILDASGAVQHAAEAYRQSLAPHGRPEGNRAMLSLTLSEVRRAAKKLKCFLYLADKARS